MSLSPRRFLGALVLFIALSSLSVQAQDSMDVWKDFDFASKQIQSTQIKSMPLEDLKLLRGIIFGKHGRIFKDAEIKVYLEAQSWFKPNADFNNSMLNDTERRNLDLIRIAEASKHETLQPGDMRYWVDRPLTLKKLGRHSGAEW